MDNPENTGTTAYPAYVLVTGGRDYDDQLVVTYWLGWAEGCLHPTTPTLVHGDARGADRLAAEVAHFDLRWQTMAVPADWETHGRSAGPRRNQRMLDDYPIRFCIAFPGGKGTADMVSRCRKAGVPVIGPGHGKPDLTASAEFDNLTRENAALREAATWLLRLKDGPRDEAYEREKPKAWAVLRDALTALNGPSAQSADQR